MISKIHMRSIKKMQGQLSKIRDALYAIYEEEDEERKKIQDRSRQNCARAEASGVERAAGHVNIAVGDLDDAITGHVEWR